MEGGLFFCPAAARQGRPASKPIPCRVTNSAERGTRLRATSCPATKHMQQHSASLWGLSICATFFRVCVAERGWISMDNKDDGAKLKRIEREKLGRKLLRQGLTGPQVAARLVEKGYDKPGASTMSEWRKQLGIGQFYAVGRKLVGLKLLSENPNITDDELAKALKARGMDRPNLRTIEGWRKQVEQQSHKPPLASSNVIKPTLIDPWDAELERFLRAMQAHGVARVQLNDKGTVIVTRRGKIDV